MNKFIKTVNWIKVVIYGFGFIILWFLSDSLGNYIDEKYFPNHSLIMENKMSLLTYPIWLVLTSILYFLFPISTLDAISKLNESRPLYSRLAYCILALIILSILTFIIISVIYSYQ